MPVVVTFESDWRKAHDLLEWIVARETIGVKESARRQIRKASREMQSSSCIWTPKVIVSVVDIGVCLTLRFLCKVRERRFLESRIWEDVLEAFSKEPSIDFAYPTTRYYDNVKEGKPGKKLVVQKRNEPQKVLVPESTRWWGWGDLNSHASQH